MKTKLLVGVLIALSLLGCGSSMFEQEKEKQSTATTQSISNDGIFGRMYYIRDEVGTCYSVIENGLTNRNHYSISHTVVDCSKYEGRFAVDRLVKK